MICTYCKKQVADENEFCPECGQPISLSKSNDSVDRYWDKTISDEGLRLKSRKQLNDRIDKERNLRSAKSLIVIVAVMLFILSGFFIGLSVKNKHDKALEAVSENIIGKTLSTHDSHSETIMMWQYHEYWQLFFKDAENVEFSYLKKIGPTKDGEGPSLIGTYRYVVNRSIFGAYSLTINGTEFKLYVNDNNEPTGIYIDN